MGKIKRFFICLVVELAAGGFTFLILTKGLGVEPIPCVIIAIIVALIAEWSVNKHLKQKDKM